MALPPHGNFDILYNGLSMKTYLSIQTYALWSYVIIDNPNLISLRELDDDCYSLGVPLFDDHGCQNKEDFNSL